IPRRYRLAETGMGHRNRPPLLPGEARRARGADTQRTADVSVGRPAIEPLADDAWLLVFGDVIDDELNRRVHATATRLSAVGLEGVQDIVPAYASLAVFFDPGEVDRARVRQHLLDAALSDTGAVETVHSRQIDVPVLYGGAAGPDLDTAAAELGMEPDELVRRHASGQYTVAMIGFAPGFPYLSGLDAD